LKILLKNKKNLAIAVAILFHVSGFIGMVYSPYKQWFIDNTSLNLGLMALLIIWMQPKKNKEFFLFACICFIVGMSTEMIGTNTGKLFGNYKYTNVMGIGINNVPYLIGINWFVVVFCSCTITQAITNWIEDKYLQNGVVINPLVQKLSFIFDAALLATIYDYALEPIAIELNFWEWQNNQVPFFNYACWFCISAILAYVYKLLPKIAFNQFAIHLFIIQYLFFLALQSFL
jgi:bisanhydrobacterioruberin hydratase